MNQTNVMTDRFYFTLWRVLFENNHRMSDVVCVVDTQYQSGVLHYKQQIKNSDWFNSLLLVGKLQVQLIASSERSINHPRIKTLSQNLYEVALFFGCRALKRESRRRQSTIFFVSS